MGKLENIDIEQRKDATNIVAEKPDRVDVYDSLGFNSRGNGYTSPHVYGGLGYKWRDDDANKRRAEYVESEFGVKVDPLVAFFIKKDGNVDWEALNNFSNNDVNYTGSDWGLSKIKKLHNDAKQYEDDLQKRRTATYLESFIK